MKRSEKVLLKPLKPFPVAWLTELHLLFFFIVITAIPIPLDFLRRRRRRGGRGCHLSTWCDNIILAAAG